MFIGSCPRRGSLVSWRHHTPPQAAGRLLCSRPSRQGCPGNMFMNMQESLLKHRSNLEHWVFPELVDECFSLPQFVIIPQDSFKQAATVEPILYVMILLIVQGISFSTREN